MGEPARGGERNIQEAREASPTQEEGTDPSSISLREGEAPPTPDHPNEAAILRQKRENLIEIYAVLHKLTVGCLYERDLVDKLSAGRGRFLLEFHEGELFDAWLEAPGEVSPDVVDCLADSVYQLDWSAGATDGIAAFPFYVQQTGPYE